MPVSHKDRSRVETTITSRASALQAELDAVRQLEKTIVSIRMMKRQSPELFEQFKQELHAVIDEEPSATAEPERIPDVVDESAPDIAYGVEKLVEFFRERNNKPASVQEMAKAIGRSDKTIKSILYHRHRGKFVAIDERGRNNRAYFRMAEE